MSTLISAIQNKKLQDMVDQYVDSIQSNLEFPVSEHLLLKTHHKVHEKVFIEFDEYLHSLQLNVTQHEENNTLLESKIDKEYKQFQNHNYREIQQQVEIIIQLEEKYYENQWKDIQFPLELEELKKYHNEFLNNSLNNIEKNIDKYDIDIP
eukprot:UN33392